MKCRVKKLNDKSFKVVDAENDEKEKSEFTAEEIKTIRKLLPHMDELMVLLEIDEKDEDFDKDEIGVEVKEEVDEDEDGEVEKIDLEEDDEFVEDDDSCEDKDVKDETFKKFVKKEEVVKDSARSFGSIERKKKMKDSAEDQEIDRQNEIAEAWKKYYGGKN